MRLFTNKDDRYNVNFDKICNNLPIECAITAVKNIQD